MVYLRGTDGSPALRLGEGEGFALSPDKKWVLARQPTGPGTPARPSTHGPPSRTVLRTERSSPGFGGAFTPDGKRVVFSAVGPDKKSRLYVLEIPAGQPRAFVRKAWDSGLDGARSRPMVGTSLGFGRAGPSSTRSTAAATDVPCRALPRAIKSLNGARTPRLFTSSMRRSGQSENLLVDLETGQKRLWKEIPLSDAAGNVRVRVTPDGRSYFVGSVVSQSELYLVEGLR